MMKNAPLRSVSPILFRPATDVEDIIAQVNPERRCFWLLVHLVRAFPQAAPRLWLMYRCGFDVQGPICGPAALEFWITQLNLDLNPVGWDIVEEPMDMYKLVRV